MTTTTSRSETLGRLAYGTLFVVALPLALVLWAARLDALIPLPAYGSPIVGGVVAGVGVLVMIVTTAALWIYGRGLPMSAYPPERFVTSWTYRYLANPMYVGAVILSLGLSLALQSPAGLWIVTPFLAVAATAWVLGFERQVTREHFGATIRQPLLKLPDASSDRPTQWDRISVYLLVFLPWLLLFQAVELLGVPRGAIDGWMSWDRALPVIPWTELIYFVTYPLLIAVPFVAASRADLRWFMTRGWIATALIIPMYLLIPVIAEAKPVVGDGLLETMLRWEREGDQPVTAFPAFHVVWMLLATIVYARRWRRLSMLWWTLAIGVAISCVTVGMHAAIDVVAGVIATVVVVRAERIWEWVRVRSERLANSWHEVMIGPVRLINHGIYAAVGSWIGIVVMVGLAGPESLWPLVAVSASSIVGAALWAQLVEGSPQLLRPYGYYGSVTGAAIALVVLGLIGYNGWHLAAAMTIGCSLAQAVNRGRCLVQGCCHGAEADAAVGIRYLHPRSRVTRLSSLGGRPLHPTQLYSALWMLTVTAILLRLWWVGAGLELIVGFYFLLTGLGRFVEEHYRGEPQTRIIAGLRLYQWLALAFIVAGALLTSAGWTPAPAPTLPTSATLAAATLFATLTYIAYGIDFPHLNARFSRLV